MVVAAGDSVSAGQTLMVIEAMKMEHSITAPAASTVETVHFSEGDQVDEGAELRLYRPNSVFFSDLTAEARLDSFDDRRLLNSQSGLVWAIVGGYGPKNNRSIS